MLAVKAREIAYAKEHGYRTIRAEIDADNPWTLHLCAELPFIQGGDVISMARVMNWTVEP
jgi:L-amino acid N-acyltransferase YncA